MAWVRKSQYRARRSQVASMWRKSLWDYWMGTRMNPAWAKCWSLVNASAIPSWRITTKLAASTSDRTLSSYCSSSAHVASSMARSAYTMVNWVSV